MRVEIGFGIGFDRYNRAIDAEFAQNAVRDIIVETCKLFGGCNVVNGQGGWIALDGTLVLEESRTLMIDIIGNGRIGGEFTVGDDEKIDRLAEFIRRKLDQAAVHVTKLVATSKDVYHGNAKAV